MIANTRIRARVSTGDRFVLLLGKALPNLFEMVDHEGLILAGYLLVTTGWLVVLSTVPGANLSALLGEWRSSWLLWGPLFGLAVIVVYFGALWPAVLAHVVFNGLGILVSAMGKYPGGNGG